MQRGQCSTSSGSELPASTALVCDPNRNSRVNSGNALLIPQLKRIFERVRPVHDHGLVSEMGFSFPSGHTAGATVAYGMLAYVALRVLPGRWHVPAVLAATALAFTIGSSRVFLQVHFASDVLAGFAWGAAWLAVCVLSVELSRRYRPGAPPSS